MPTVDGRLIIINTSGTTFRVKASEDDGSKTFTARPGTTSRSIRLDDELSFPPTLSYRKRVRIYVRSSGERVWSERVRYRAEVVFVTAIAISPGPDGSYIIAQSEIPLSAEQEKRLKAIAKAPAERDDDDDDDDDDV